MNKEWLDYYEATKDNSPSKTAVRAAQQFGEQPGLVMDLGCGAGVDALYFLHKGWEVLAVDSHVEYLRGIKEKMPIELQHKLEVCERSFEQLSIKQPVDCVIANFSLPFCNPQYFDVMWTEIVKGLKARGIFSGVFFGNRDSWASWAQEERTFHTRQQVKDLFAEFDILDFREEEWDGSCCGEKGEAIPKHWHIFRVLARKMGQ